ncbi:MAG: succinyl-diaminopimelate desuccinylase [Rhodobacterales bacterium]|nr:succinyl-diaminopimelate desuccinylase [Rhodobacterales bacterium]
MTLDALELAQALMRRPSITPQDAGALDVLVDALEPLGFTCHRLPFSADGTADVDNLYARLGTTGPNLCFAGHTDVVPVGDRDAWSVDPFAAQVKDGWLYGRGASDMKAAIAAFVAAASRRVAARGADGLGGSISLLITGDEEGPAINGTRKVLDWLAGRGEAIDACIVGEPTSVEAVGDMAKIGRRGSLNGFLTVTGTQGHSAYPALADNPLPRLVRMLDAIAHTPLDHGSDHFPATTVALTTIDVGNPATNVIPAQGRAGFNIRFNDLHSGASVTEWLHERCRQVGGDYALDVWVSGESFLTPPGPLSDALADAVEQVTGRRPELSTTGGTSDARFIKDHCPVIELGLTNATAHKVDERVPAADVDTLRAIYGAFMDAYFGA